jgi:alpha-galactosidase
MWFDVERVHRDTQIHRDHPDWLLADRTPGSDQTYFLRWFGNPDTVKGTYEQTAHYLKMTGLNFYRQDYNGQPLTYWRSNDEPNRRGIHEILHVMGMLQYWKMLADDFPHGVREECAGGGNRIDLDTISIMHHHQKSDMWGVPHAAQSGLMGLSHYLPNNCFHGFCRLYTEYDFRSVIAGSLCHGWSEIIKDTFDPTLGQRLIDEYYSIHHLLIDAWYPLTAQTIDLTLWLASQYHRKDLDEGMILAFRRENSPYGSLDVNLRWIDPDAMYRLKYYSFPDNKPVEIIGSQLLKSFPIKIPQKKASEIMTYKKTTQTQ